jgi:hypothetical protein
VAGDNVKLNGEIAIILQELAAIKATLKAWGPPDRATCAVHGQKLDEIESRVAGAERQIAGDRKITVGVSAVTAGIILAIKWVFVK